MPNHVTNQISFGSDAGSLAAFRQMLEDVREPGQPLGTFDFNKLIPLPKDLEIESSTATERGLKLYRTYMRELAQADPADAARIEEKWSALKEAEPDVWALGEQAYQNVQKHGYPTWYEWANRNWGTKWNAYQCAALGKDADTMIFLTAWSSVPQIVSALSRKYPEQTITYRWADEDIGQNVGEMVFQGGDCIGLDIPANGSPAAYAMASEILEIDQAEFGEQSPTQTAKKKTKGSQSKER